MPYITSIERIGRKEGHEKGRRVMGKLVSRQLHQRFPELQDADLNRVQSLSMRRLEALGEAVLNFSNADEVREWLASK